MANFVELSIRSRERTELIKRDGQVKKFVTESGMKEGVLHIHVPHTTDRAAPTHANEGTVHVARRAEH